MENITPTLILLWDVKRSIQKGQSVRFGAEIFVKRHIQHAFYRNFCAWFALRTLNSAANKDTFNYLQRQLIDLIELGLGGESVLLHLNQLEKEIIRSCEEEVASYLATLPLKALVPLVCCLFPAMFLLLLVPLLKMLQF
jgi:hypothetical protein